MLSLPLAKLSVAHDTDPSVHKFTWQHETQNLTFVIDSYGDRDSSQLLKVVQGTQVRQMIELERLIQEGNEMARSMHERGVQLKADQLPVSAIVRCPLLALRWQLPDQKIRRAQIKFVSSGDYDAAYNHLLHLGLRMSSSVNEGQAHSRPSTPSPKRTSASRSNLPAATTSHQPAIVSLSCPPSRLAEISNRPYTATTAPTPLDSRMQDPTPLRPVSALTSYGRAEHTTSSLSDALIPPIYFPRPSSSTTDILGQSSSSSTLPGYDNPLPTTEHILEDASARPETAMLFGRPTTAEALLPPRRELPFQRLSMPRSSGSDSARSPSRPSTSFMGPPPLPARVVSLRPSSARDANQDTELPPLPQPTVISNATFLPQTMQQAPRTPNQEHDTHIGGQNSSPRDTENRPLSDYSRPASCSPSSSSSPLLSKRASFAAGLSSRPLSPLSNAAQNLQRTMSPNLPATAPTSEATYQIPTAPGHALVNQVNDDGRLAAYAMQSEEGRRATLDEFMLRHLESDDFITLVEDMETCCARVMLGTR